MATDIGSASDPVSPKKTTMEGLKQLLLFVNMAHTSLFEP